MRNAIIPAYACGKYSLYNRSLSKKPNSYLRRKIFLSSCANGTIRNMMKSTTTPAGATLQLPESCDVVVIGAGIGGLTAAAFLAKAGLHVCVLEMAARPGGYLAGFERNGFKFETAIHWLNQCGTGGFVDRIFNIIAPGSPATTENSRIRRLKSDSFDYLLTNNPDEMRDTIISRHCSEKRDVLRFFNAGKTAARAFSRMTRICRSPETMPMAERAALFTKVNLAALPLIRYSLFSAEKGLSTFFNSSGIKELFCTEENLLSCLLPVGWAYENDYQLPPSGGSQAFPAWLCAVLARWNTTVAYHSRVTKIIVDKGRATGVSVVRNGMQKDIAAPYVIAACDVDSLYTRMLPSGTVSDKILEKQRNAELFDSCTTLSLGLDCPPSELGLNEEQVLLRRDGITRKEHGCTASDKTEISVIASSFRDPTLAPQGKGTITVCASSSIDFGNYWGCERDENGGFLRGKAYQSFKKKYADELLRRVNEKLIPGLLSHIEVLDIATPITYLRYTGNRNGAIMGFRPSFKNIRNRIAHYSTPVKNLFIGGQWAEFGGGVPVAVRAGMNSALLVLKKESPESYRIVCRAIDGRIPPEAVTAPRFLTL
jgi:phytoene dehydrogenase-like protein